MLDFLAIIARIERYTAGLDANVFPTGGVIPYAIERCFERICGAAKKVGTQREELFALPSYLGSDPANFSFNNPRFTSTSTFAEVDFDATRTRSKS